MVQFVLGGSGSGKTDHLHERIRECCRGEQAILFVPEQFTYETEKTLFHELGAAFFCNVMVTSFTRFSTEIFKRFGGMSGEYVTDSARVVLMEMAIDAIYGELDVYRKSAHSRSFASTILETVSEFKNAGVTDVMLNDALVSMDKDSYLYKKTSELGRIYGAYNAKLYSTYKDSLDDISRATDKLKGRHFFEDYHIFIDEFKGFTANENGMLKRIFGAAKSTTVGLCLDLERVSQGEISAFESVRATYNRLTRLCREAGAEVAVPIRIDAQRRIKSDMLAHLENNLFNPIIDSYAGVNNNSLQAVLCKNEYDEVDFVLASVSSLVEQDGYHYNDIAIISRNMDAYISKLEISAKKYAIPIFSDIRVHIATKPLIRFVKLCIECVQNGYRTDDILALLKCDIIGINIKIIAELENYTFIWGVDRKQWFSPFESCPRGFSDNLTDEDKLVLEQINAVREKVVAALSEFELVAKMDTSAKKCCLSLLKLLDVFQVSSYMETQIRALSAHGELVEAQMLHRTWGILAEIIDTIAVVAGDERITLKQLHRMYSLICDTYDMGTLPQSLDCVTVGSAERIRISDKRAVFIMGVNENIFPLNPASSGIFTDKERADLIALELQISPPMKDRILEERFVAYKTMTSASERLYLTAKKSDISGKSAAVSEIFHQLERMFGNIVSDAELLSGEFFCRSQPTAFSFLARRYFEDTTLNATIKMLLREQPEYAVKLQLLDTIAEHRAHNLTPHVAQKLFGQEMRISPTRVEGYHQCAFKYFCEHGLRVRALRRAELNPIETGTLIHDIIYTITKSYDLSKEFDEVGVKKRIKAELDRYMTDNLGGVKEKTSRFIYLYNRLSDSIFKVIVHLHEELNQSLFEPADFEYEISEDSDVKPLYLTAQNGAKIVVSGKIDRVDVYENKLGKRFVRIVDYKSGKKIFSLDDVYNGLNLQMLIYLFCIQHNGQDKYDGIIPAGILYMPASEVEPELSRNATESDTKELKARHYRMNGLILNDSEIIQAMDSKEAGMFIPISRNKDGSFSKASMNSLADLTELGKIDKYIKSLLLRMADSLQSGKIEAYPVGKTCDYCDFSSVCGRGEHTQIKSGASFSREQVVLQMEADAKNGDAQPNNKP